MPSTENEEPQAPTGVRFVDHDGNERRAVVEYAGQTSDGITRWYVIDPQPGPYAAIRVDILPAHSELILPYQEEPP